MRRLLGGVAVGHWGTLDPGACGVLVLAVGAAARLLPLIADSRKRYTFELVVGVRTDSGDAAGKILDEIDPPHDWLEQMRGVVSSFVGALEQTPPMRSAVKVAGRPLYRFARAGKIVDRPTRRITIYDLRLLGAPSARAARLSVECDAGTYVRTLCEQIGERIGVPAHMGMLVRTAAGPFGLSGAKLPGEIAREPQACIVDPLTVLTQQRIELAKDAAHRFAHGNPVTIDDSRPRQADHVLVLGDARIIGIGKIATVDGKPYLAPTRVLV